MPNIQPSDPSSFLVGLSADFRNADGTLAYPNIGLALLDAEPGLSYSFMHEYFPEYRPEQLAPYDVMISLKARVSAASLAGVERLCAIGRFGVGYDNIDLAGCTASDVVVYIAAGAVSRPMAESVVLFILALSHNLVANDRLMRQGKWPESTRELGREPLGRVVGTIGLGGIGSEMVRMLEPFRLGRVLAFDPFAEAARFARMGVESVGLDTLLAQSDYVVVNCLLNKGTHHMVGEAQLRRMKPTAVLINAARGAIVDEAALIRALESRTIRAAALDVFEQEPLAADSPLLRLDNVILTSHSVGWTEELFRGLGEMDCLGAIEVFRGRPPAHVVNPEVLERPGFRAKLDRYRKAQAERTVG